MNEEGATDRYRPGTPTVIIVGVEPCQLSGGGYDIQVRACNEIFEVTAGIVTWSAYDPSVKCDLSSTAVRTAAGWILVDPIPLQGDLMTALLEGEHPAAVLITSANHPRAFDVIAIDHPTPIFASNDSGLVGEGGVRAFESGLIAVAGAPAVFAVPGAAPGEVFFHFPEHDLVVLGDAVVNLEAEGFMLLPDKYCGNPKAMRKALRQLEALEFSLVCFAHGTPLVTNAKQRVLSLLD